MTMAAFEGIPDSLVQMLSHWVSSAYLSYIQTPRDSLCADCRVHITRLNTVLLLNAVFMYGNIGTMVLYNNCVMNVCIHFPIFGLEVFSNSLELTPGSYLTQAHLEL